MPWLELRDTLKPGCYGEVSCHGTHGHQNYCLGLNHMENGGLEEKQVRSVFGQFMTVTLHGRGKSLLSSSFV